MKNPETVEEIISAGVIIHYHAGLRLVERAGFHHSENLTRGAIGLLSSGVIFGGQYGDEVSVLCTNRDNGIELVFILKKLREGWLMKTVLTKDQAIANMESR